MATQQNITPLFTVKDGSIEHARQTVNVVSQLTVAFNQFALVWFIKGTAFLKNEDRRSMDFSLLSKITNILLESTDKPQDVPYKPVNIKLLGGDMRTLITWLSARIDHCQEQRDSEDENVSKMYQHETMLDMKQLRIDMSERLIVNSHSVK